MTSRAIHVRRATPSDLELVVKFNHAMAVETEGKTLDHAILIAGVRAALQDESRSLYFVAEVEGKVVGQTMVTVEWSDWRHGFFWWIQSVYVDPPYRRQGVFRALHEHVRGLAKGRGDVCGLRLYVHRHNQRAIETYQKLGMTRTDYLVCEEDWSANPAQ